MALSPHWLDDVFRGDDLDAITRILLSADQFQDAVRRAVRRSLIAKREGEERLDDDPEQAAREMFIDLLSDEVENW